jgi:glycosyltransferase involved in cell wall biosynthesis
MVEVLRRVRAEVPGARLIVYGRATEDVVPHLAGIVAGFPAGVLSVEGGIPYGRIDEMLARAHVGLSLLRPHPKYEKNVSMKVFDYMAAGLPYVASDFRPLREATDGVGGRLVTPGDPVEAAEAVLGLLRDAGAASRAGREGRALVESRLNWESMEPRLFGLYEELLSRPTGSVQPRR